MQINRVAASSGVHSIREMVEKFRTDRLGCPALNMKRGDAYWTLDYRGLQEHVRSLGAATVTEGDLAKTVALSETMDKFAQHLTVHLGHPVANKTSLTGAYDFTLIWTQTEVPSISAPMEKQLGLRLEKRVENVDVLVIDGAEKKPIAN